MMIKKIKLGNTNEMVSQYTLGAMMMGTIMNEADAFEVLDDFVKRGGNFIDTANNYAWWIGTGEYCGDESELLLGRWMKKRDNRKDIFLATKVAARQIDHMALRDEDGIPRWDEIPDHFEGASKAVIRKGLEDSLRRLQTDYIDLYYIHVDDRKTPLEETLFEMDALIKEGKIRYYGYSNVQTWRLEKIMMICEQNGFSKPVMVQQEYGYINPAKYEQHPYANHAKEDLFDWLTTRDEISLTAYSPLSKGAFVSDGKRDSLLKDKDYDTAYTREKIERVRLIAKQLGTSPNAVVLAWMAQNPANVFPILGFSKKEQYYENIQCSGLVLSDAVMNELNS